jgi:hypothetical protein
MTDITITSKKAIFIPDLDNSTTYSIEFYFPPACKLTNTSDAPVRGGYEILGNKIDITFTSPESINISGIVNDDMIIGQCKIETRIQRNFLCVFYYKRNFGELKAKICLLFNILNEKSGHINLISPAIIEKWISQFADSNQNWCLLRFIKS